MICPECGGDVDHCERCRGMGKICGFCMKAYIDCCCPDSLEDVRYWIDDDDHPTDQD